MADVPSPRSSLLVFSERLKSIEARWLWPPGKSCGCVLQVDAGHLWIAHSLAQHLLSSHSAFLYRRRRQVRLSRYFHPFSDNGWPRGNAERTSMS